MRRLLILSACLLGLTGCDTVAYYLQAADGQISLMTRSRPVERIIADAATDPALRDRLRTASDIRAFASARLALPDNRSYRKYVDLQRPFPVWNVVAAPEFSVTAVESCFPIAGCVPYRGYFSEAEARRHAARLREQGNDVFVYGVPAYSTLGWFDDPLLSSFIRYPDAELARLVFHELAHQRVYAKGDASFNESFAVVVEREGVRRWLAATGRSGELESFLTMRKRADEFVGLIRDARQELREVYASAADAGSKRALKQGAFQRLASRYAELKSAWGGFSGYDRYFDEPPGNALLVSFETYSALVPAFERLLKAEGGDLERFYGRVAEIAARPEAERRRLLGMTAADR